MTSWWTGVGVRLWLYYGTAAFHRTDHVESGAADLADPWLKLETTRTTSLIHDDTSNALLII